MSESAPPPPPSGGGTRYAIIGLLLLLGALGLYFATKEETQTDPIAAVPVDAGAAPQRAQQFAPEFEIPEEEPDAGPQDAGTPEESMSAMMVSGGPRRPRACDGEIDRAAVARVVQQQRPQVRSCYERRLKVNNLLQGVVNVRMRIGRTGNVESVAVGGSLRDSEVFSCVRRLAQSWEFPAVAGGSCAEVSAPFRLTPRP